MVVATIVGVSIVAVAFMAVFFVGICRDSSCVNFCEVMRLDTEPIGSARRGDEVEHVQQDKLVDRVPSVNMKVVQLRSAKNLSRSADRRIRKPA